MVNVGALGRRDEYLDALLAELEREREAGRIGALETVYLGGGTPTLMRPRRLARPDGPHPPAPGARRRGEHGGQPRVGRTARRSPPCAATGVNRLSLGVQSFQPHLLAALDRAATPGPGARG